MTDPMNELISYITLFFSSSFFGRQRRVPDVVSLFISYLHKYVENVRRHWLSLPGGRAAAVWPKSAQIFVLLCAIRILSTNLWPKKQIFGQKKKSLDKKQIFGPKNASFQIFVLLCAIRSEFCQQIFFSDGPLETRINPYNQTLKDKGFGGKTY